jgi:hypothetical protein
MKTSNNNCPKLNELAEEMLFLYVQDNEAGPTTLVQAIDSLLIKGHYIIFFILA